MKIFESTMIDKDASEILSLLSNELIRITGNDGVGSINNSYFENKRSVFLLAKENDEIIGCGGIRPISINICEVKRMYSKYPKRGIGSVLIRELEKFGKRFQYNENWIETRRINDNAVRFYINHEYETQVNYGKYIGREDAICFHKQI
jgi:GNAT superfamily N-acetyltransferase